MGSDLRTTTFAAEADISEPFEVLRVGDYKRSGDDFEVTEQSLDSMVSNFQAAQEHGHEIPVDWDHSFAEGGTSKAAGWIKSLFRKGQSLFAQVKWTDQAKQDIESEHFRFISAEFSDDWKDEHGDAHGPTLLAAGLTNRPFLRGMTPVALSDRTEKEINTLRLAGVDEIERQIHALSGGKGITVTLTGDLPTEGLRASETPREVSETATEKKDREAREAAAKTLGVKTAAEDSKAGDIVTLAEGQVVLTEEKVKELTDAAEKAKTLSEKESENKTLSDRVTKLEEALTDERKALTDERFSRIFSQAQREGRVDAKDETRETWRERVTKFGLGEVEKLLSELPAETIPVKERGSSAGAADVVPEEAGVDHEAAVLDREIKALSEKEDISYTEAAIKLGSSEGAKV